MVTSGIIKVRVFIIFLVLGVENRSGVLTMNKETKGLFEIAKIIVSTNAMGSNIAYRLRGVLDG